MATTIAPQTLTEKIEIAKQIVSALSDVDEVLSRRTYGNKFDWENLLSPAPDSIRILGDLMAVAACMSDFSLIGAQPKDGYKFIQHPISFRASLVQISNSSYQAFNSAHTNMDQICLYTRGIPTTMEQVKQILESKNMKMIDKILPILLEQIRVAAEQSATCSKEVVGIFDQLIKLTGELLTAVTATKGLTEKQRDDTREEQKVLDVVAKLTATTLEETKKDKEYQDKMVEEAQGNFYEAIREMPSGVELLVMNVLEGLGDSLTGGATFIYRALSRIQINYPGTHSTDVPEKVNLDNKYLLDNTQNVLKIFGIASELDKFAARDFKNMDSSIKSEYSAAIYINMLAEIAKDALGCDKVKKISQAGITVMKTLEGLLSSESCNDTKEVREQIQDFFKQAAELTKTVQSMNNPASGRTTSMPNVQPTFGGAAQLTAGNWKHKVNILQKEHEVALENAEKARVRMAENIRDNIEAQTKLQRMKFSEMSYVEAIKLLHVGLDNLSQLKKHWSNLENFFQEVGSVVKASMNPDLYKFRDLVEETRTDVDLLNFQPNLQIIYITAEEASQASSFIHAMTDMYTKVSAKYIMPNIVNLNQLIAFDAKKAGITIDEKRQELDESCSRDITEIHKLIVAEKTAFTNRIKDMLKIADQYASMQTNSGI